MIQYSKIPYGPAPAFAFPIFEIFMYLLFILCFVHSLKKSFASVSFLFGGICFGLLLEFINVNYNLGYAYGKFNLGYTYGKFMVMFGTAPHNIPLCIGVGWGVILYSARLFTDFFRLPIFTGSMIEALLALSIDLNMDVVAYRLHMWHWNWDAGYDPLSAEWFGIPYGNFSGWLCVVFFYSFFFKYIQKLLFPNSSINNIKIFVVPFLSIILSQISLFIALVFIKAFLKVEFGITSTHKFIVFFIILSVCVINGWKKKKVSSSSFPIIAWLVPAVSHIYFFSFLIICGFYKENVWLIIIATLNLIINFILHFAIIKASNKSSVKYKLFNCPHCLMAQNKINNI